MPLNRPLDVVAQHEDRGIATQKQTLQQIIAWMFDTKQAARGSITTAPPTTERSCSPRPLDPPQLLRQPGASPRPELFSSDGPCNRRGRNRKPGYWYWKRESGGGGEGVRTGAMPRVKNQQMLIWFRIAHARIPHAHTISIF